MAVSRRLVVKKTLIVKTFVISIRSGLLLFCVLWASVRGSLSNIYWVVAAKRLDWQYSIKQTSNHKTYTDKRLEIELPIIRKYVANKRIFESVCRSKQLR